MWAGDSAHLGVGEAGVALGNDAAAAGDAGIRSAAAGVGTAADSVDYDAGIGGPIMPYVFLSLLCSAERSLV